MSIKPDYVFTRDFFDNTRVNLQHYLFVELFGYLLHPKIPTQKSNLRVADVGTGTCIWIRDLVSKLPSTTQFDGLDISFDASPSKWLPPNVALHLLNLKDPVPDEFIDVYDIVHIRNFSFVLMDEEIPLVLDHLIQMLKPGGYLQWDEPDVASFRVEKTNPENNASALEELFPLTVSQDERLKPHWVPSIGDLFSERGLQDVESDVRDPPPSLALPMHECSMMIPTAIARQTYNTEVAQKLSSLMPKIVEETKEGSCWAFTRYVVVGRKPEA
ncbi:hypothetical protein ABKA04_001031 [Annulohypoxylon sp. FPYF3050]